MTREQMRAAVETCDRELEKISVPKDLFDLVMMEFFDGIARAARRPYIDVDFRVLPDVKGALTNGST